MPLKWNAIRPMGGGGAMGAIILPFDSEELFYFAVFCLISKISWNEKKNGFVNFFFLQTLLPHSSTTVPMTFRSPFHLVSVRPLSRGQHPLRPITLAVSPSIPTTPIPATHSRSATPKLPTSSVTPTATLLFALSTSLLSVCEYNHNPIRDLHNVYK